ncbi:MULTISPECIES: helix-turn-helix domain-containing protein [unclassified Streptomyces]|uniref:helix-turn-helix domain-containing protein n=1 Tax=unclassified Streptomyces TaxID=2593676 RepID=UPI0013CD202B|nr:MULTISPECIES: helix-turn-helix transcriptional regulator [unclassified Streptomyces]MCZ4095681.1 helix-turn-helix transcriptional regulator [Streptomyces sp. H39-C1]NEA72174.1 helix-turn-helix domain-containing protein [Streptomyces sp. SID13588]
MPKPRELKPGRSARDLFGADMRRLRAREKWSLAEMADRLPYSKSHLARIEGAEILAPPELAPLLDTLFSTDEHFVGLFRLARREAHPGKYRPYMELEAEAVKIEQYAAQAVPGLLQTEEYARALLECDREATEERIEELVAARMSRQELLRLDPPPHSWTILDEAVLRRTIGGCAVMQEQLAALLPLVDSPTTTIQVLPFSHGAHALLGGSLTLLTLPEGEVAAYEEGIDMGHLYEDLSEVQKRQRAYDALRGYAPSPRRAAALISSALEDCKSCEPPPT